MRSTPFLAFARSLALVSPMGVSACAAAAHGTSPPSLASESPPGVSPPAQPVAVSAAEPTRGEPAPTPRVVACPASAPAAGSACATTTRSYCAYSEFTGQLIASADHGSTECGCVDVADAGQRSWSCEIVQHVGPAAPPELSAMRAYVWN